MNKYIKCILSLTLICGVIAVMLAAANYITAPVIAKNEEAAANAALLVVMPDGEDFTAVDMASFSLPESVNSVHTEKNGGVVVNLTVTGFNPNMTVMVGVAADGTVTGATCLSSEETLGYEKTYGDSVKGASIDTIDAVDTISGATKTTAAYKSAVRDALNTAIIVGGGEAVKSEEELFAEELAASLPAADGFTPVFMLDKLEGFEGAYSANNGVGYVVCIGGKLIATDVNGVVLTDGLTTEEKAMATSVAATISSWELNPVDLAAYDMPTAIEEVYVSNCNTYVFNLKAAGYGINGGDQYHPVSGEYIKVKVSLTADGEIIDCITVSQSESAGIGDACANEEFYSQFDGKTVDNYIEIDAISKATITTDGYVKAIGRAFEALAILTGGETNE